MQQNASSDPGFGGSGFPSSPLPFPSSFSPNPGPYDLPFDPSLAPVSDDALSNGSPVSSPPTPRAVQERIVKVLSRPANGSRVPYGAAINETLAEAERKVSDGKRKRSGEEDEMAEESWNVGRMLRERCGVDPLLFGWRRVDEDFVDVE
jgi:hypothetical protein